MSVRFGLIAAPSCVLAPVFKFPGRLDHAHFN
jgi:hypothetical protein